MTVATDARLKVGLIGYGYAGKTFHAPLIAAVPALELAAVASSDAAKVHADWPGVTVHATPAELIARDDLDLVVIATPNDTHHPLARAALLAGRHVVVDKPFTVALDDARELVALARERGRVLSVFHNRRWDGDFLTLQQLVADGALGRVVELNSRHDRWRPEVRQRWREAAGPGAGLWFDLGPHLVDQAMQLFGRPRAISLERELTRDGALADDWFHASLRYDRLRVHLHAGMLMAASAPRFAVHGTLASFVKDGLDAQEDALKAGVRPTWPPQPGWGIDPGRASRVTRAGDGTAVVEPVRMLPGAHMAYFAGVAAAIRGEAANPVPPEEALAVMGLIELGIRSAEERRELEWTFEDAPAR
ncbi:oxidoreductase [Scleromatobacter humisilvae]|uniref:Oxidoreductase n=1 Tax=Scleromatobacter humisilvae TaxID=2897159 RepID=A0A9X1YM61_9BURK|nr:oxidoreductase [Scleromatobacter humisilvae]MCK9686932.1 oxidoreductase [Scleromatobacter humisilvae]